MGITRPQSQGAQPATKEAIIGALAEAAPTLLSIQELAARTRLAEATVNTATQQLEANGLVAGESKSPRLFTLPKSATK